MSVAAGEARIHSLAEAVDRLASPYAEEELATLTGEGLLVVDLPPDAGTSPDAGALDDFGRRLGGLACPTLAIRPRDRSARVDSIAALFDLWVEDEGALSALVDPIRRTPIASLALVQLLRHSEGRPVHDGLIAESLVYSTLQSGAEFAKWSAGRVGSPEPTDDPEAVRVVRDGATLRITFDRPARHNAFGVALRDGLVEGLRLAAADATIEEVVLSGEGPSFCSGGDLDEFGSFPDAATAHAIRSTRHPGRLLAALADRARAVVHGACIGAGVELPAFTCRVAAREDAFFQLPEVGMGLVPGAGGTVSLPRRIGRQRTAWLALTGERIDVARALDWGLIDAIATDP